MKTYEECKRAKNYISLSHLIVYNDLLKSNNLDGDYKMWDGSIFLLLAHADIDELLIQDFEDYQNYFDIELVEQNIPKENEVKLFNIYKLIYKE